MSIERMRHVVVLAPSAQRDRVIEWLYGERQIQLAPFRDVPEDWTGRFPAARHDTSQAETEVSRLQSVASFLRDFRPDKPAFLEGIFPVRIVASPQRIREAAGAVDSEALHGECQRLSAAMDAVHEERARLAAEREHLEQFAFLGADLPRVKELRHVLLSFVAASEENSKAFLLDETAREALAWEAVARVGNTTIYAVVAPAGQAQALHAFMAGHGLREIAPPAATAAAAEELRRVAKAANDLDRRLDGLQAEARELASKWAATVDLALAHWESERSRLLQQANTASSRNLFAARGYVRARRLDRFRALLAEAFPAAAVVPWPAPGGDQPPVSLAWNPFFRPMGFLVRMFGLPRYDTFDPTAYLTFSFLIFFGICFGDVVYGLMLIALSLMLRRRFRNQPGLVQFFTLFTYSGISTVLFGVLLGGMASDLPSYFGQGNWLDALRRKLMIFDPLAKPVLAIGIAVGIGVVNQLYGILLRLLRDWWRGDVRSALFDGVFWLLYLISLMAAGLAALEYVPRALLVPSLMVLVPSALGLVLTQGRDQKNWVVRLIMGIVSLYGIMGTYGTSSFVGDVLSHTRLLALGLTTSIVGMAFNMVATLVKFDVPVLGWMLFAGVCVFGHVFNFMMSVLGSFIHPARLIFLEFFGRFYEAGGQPFQPFGFQSSKVELE